MNTNSLLLNIANIADILLRASELMGADVGLMVIWERSLPCN